MTKNRNGHFDHRSKYDPHTVAFWGASNVRRIVFRKGELPVIFTIGTSDRTLAGFGDEIAKRNIGHLIDVRSSPRSRFAHFNAGQIERWCERAGVYYRWAGDVLGGRSEIDIDDDRYVDALSVIVQAANREPVAIFCAEGAPHECHRNYEIGATLLVRFGVEPVNIRRDGSDQRVTETLAFTKPGLIPESIRGAVMQRLATPQIHLPF